MQPKNDIRDCDIVMLSEDEFYDFYLPKCKPSEDSSDDFKNMIKSNIELLSSNLTNTLSNYWKENEDFMISYDWNLCMSHSMGIYSCKMYCAEFLGAVRSVMKDFPRWGLHIACENDNRGHGQLFFWEGLFYADKDSDLDYSQFAEKITL